MTMGAFDGRKTGTGRARALRFDLSMFPVFVGLGSDGRPANGCSLNGYLSCT